MTDRSTSRYLAPTRFMSLRPACARATSAIAALVLTGFATAAQSQQNPILRTLVDSKPWAMNMNDGTEGRLTLKPGGVGEMAIGSRTISPSWREGEKGELCLKPMLVIPERCATLRRDGNAVIGIRDGQVQFRLTRP